MRRTALWIAVVAAGVAGSCDSPSEPPLADATALRADGLSNVVNPAIIARVSGSAQRDAAGQPAFVNFSAVKFADGTVQGHYMFRALGTDPDQWLKVRVTCMTIVDGNKVWMGGVTTDAFLPELIGRVSYFYAFDNGEGANAEADIVSRVRAGDVDGEDQVFCAERPELLGHIELLRGNVQIEG